MHRSSCKSAVATSVETALSWGGQYPRGTLAASSPFGLRWLGCVAQGNGRSNMTGATAILRSGRNRSGERALHRIYEQHGSAVYGAAVGLCGPADADRVTLDVFLDLWRSPDQLGLQEPAMRGLLLSNVRRRAVQHARQPGFVDPDAASRAELAARLRQRIAGLSGSEANPALSDNQLVILALVHLRGCTMSQVAEQVGGSIHDVAAELRLALRDLSGCQSAPVRGSEPAP